MINIEFETKCYSCSACISICNKRAISFNERLHPVIDLEKCIACGRCERVCPEYANMNPINPIKGDCFIGRTRDEEVLKKSSSGGIFYQLAKHILLKGGYVCGCVFDKDFNTKHIVTNSMQDVLRMLGSKYVTSNLSDSFAIIRDIINTGGIVLFSGTPCQTAAVRRIVGNDSNLITVAVVCHGSIEPHIWQRYLSEKGSNRSIKSITMRDKSHGWLNYGLIINYTDGTSYKGYRNETGYFLQAFVRGLMERERCLECRFKGSNIIADILLGDGWGIEMVENSYNDGKGVSDIICLTPLGLQTLREIQNNLDIKEHSIDYVVSHNPRISSPAPRNPHLLEFRNGLATGESIEALCKKYTRNSFFSRLKKWVHLD